MKLLYNIGIGAYHLGIRLYSPFNGKARKFLQGRQNWQEKLKAAINHDAPILWFHCASLGEFEQGRSLIEAIKKKHPKYKVLLTFYSPSGYEVRKEYKHADWVFYLPTDGASNAKRFLEIVQPKMAVFVKYEFWFHYLNALKTTGIKTYIVSAIFRPDQHFFKWYGGWFRKMLNAFDHIFVQDDKSLELLQSIDIEHVSKSGDTRFDRVFAITATKFSIPIIEDFKQGQKVIIVGSSWPAEERMIARFVKEGPKDIKFIIAPHEVHKSHIDSIMSEMPSETIKYSEATVESIKDARVLVIDNIGMLSNLYQYAEIAVIGGGFGRGIHNTLEAATFGLPVIIGPNYKKFKEAIDLVDRGGAFAIHNYDGMSDCLKMLLENDEKLKAASTASRSYVELEKGATDAILEELKSLLG